MPHRPLVLIHGYSASAASYDRWREVFLDAGYAPEDLHVVNYKSLTNEVTIGDLGEGFDRALRVQTGLDADEDFDAVVHSTGMLVVRAWLTAWAERKDRLKHLVALAPATFGSPLAHKGRGMLGAVFGGNREVGPDFLEAGDRILDGLELGSPFTWRLAELDLLGEETYYGATSTTPFVFIFCGVDGFPFPRSVVNTPGSDGTVRLAGAALNTRKFTLDLTRAARGRKRARVEDWSNVDIPVVPIEDNHHSSIMSEPTDALQRMVLSALEVESASAFETWLKGARKHAEDVFGRLRARRRKPLHPWQQIVFRVVDERGDPVPDYYIEFISRAPGEEVWKPVGELFPDFDYGVHVYRPDPSYRCFHVDLDSADLRGHPVGLRLLASSGTDLMCYHGYQQRLEVRAAGNGGHTWDGVIDLSDLRKDIAFFYPFTTTLVEVRLDREPLPLTGENRLVNFPGSREARVRRAAAELAAEGSRSGREERLRELEALVRGDG